MTRLQALITERGIKQRWLADQLGVSKDRMHRWCSGKSAIDPEYIRPLAKLLRVRQKDLRDD